MGETGAPRADERLLALLNDLRALPAETEWVEFKENNPDHQMIGKTVSALSNTARLVDQPCGYMVWGVQDGTHEIVGTSFQPSKQKQGAEPLEFWLSKALQPSIQLTFCPLEVNGEKVVLLKIPAASTVPVKFMGIAYARIGEATPKLADFPEREAALLAKLRPFAWEAGVAVDFVQGVEVLALLDHEAYFRLTGQRRPDNIEAVLDHLAKDRLIVRDVGGRWGILNLGAMLFAKDLKEFGSLSRKAPRVVRYQGNDRTKTERETEGNRGYALAFERLIDFVNSSLPSHERVGKALREQEYVYPEIAVRELVANGLIHQDLTITGAGPMIEIFADRVELTNPGRPLIEPRRFMDLPPRSRNENLASLMRRMKICEERGSGIDKVVAAVELAQLPPPDFLSLEDNTRAILYGPRKFLDMDATERLRACYWHAVLKFVRSEGMTNATLRERLGVEERNSSQISRLIGQAVDAGLIKQSESFNARTGYYLPFWA